MRAGDLRHSITIQSQTESGTGPFKTTSYGDVITTFAGVWPLKGQERLEALRLSQEITHKIVMRYYAGITTKHRIKFNDPDGARYFNIVSVVNPDERNISLAIYAKETE